MSVLSKNKPPYVCNGCSQLSKCTLLKRIYDPADAHERAHHAVSEARTGIMSNEDDIARITRDHQSFGKMKVLLHHMDGLLCISASVCASTTWIQTVTVPHTYDRLLKPKIIGICFWHSAVVAES